MLFFKKQRQDPQRNEEFKSGFVDQSVYIEHEASSKQWISSVAPSWNDTREYIISLFPVFTWIYRYNWVWFLGDIIAGVTIGMIVIPQGMAYAKLAQLPPEFGLYSSFVGCSLYFIFGTSKDITVGPVAVVSTLIGHMIQDVLPELPQYKDTPWVLAGCLSLMTGCIIAAIGLLRLGFIIEFIPFPAIAAFITGASLNIAMGQIPTLMGNKSVKEYNTNEATYLVFGNFFKYIKHCNINAAVGLTALLMLYCIRWACRYSGKRWPRYERVFFFTNTLRSAFVILLYTLISYLVNHNSRGSPKFSIIGTIPVGLKHVGVPTIDSDIVSKISGRIPATLIVLVIEHISIAKSFGRSSSYTINPNQELISIGVANIFGPFLGSYPATGSFTRTAIMSKAGVRTPLAGLVTGAVVIISIYALPSALYYIPNAVLSGVIIHAVGDLISGPSEIKAFWRISPFEFFIYWVGVIVCVFTSIDNGIYAAVGTSAALMLFRIAKAKGKFVGYIRVHEKRKDGDEREGGNELRLNTDRTVFVALDYSNGVNPQVRSEVPSRGIFIYRLTESCLYPNAAHFTDHLVEQITGMTRPGVVNPYGSLGNRPWNDPGPRHKTETDIDPTQPELRAIILDFSGVFNIDVTSVQTLADVRKQLDVYANRSVGWYFSSVNSPWIRRALTNGGFWGSGSATCNVFSVAAASNPVDEGGIAKTISDEEKGLGDANAKVTSAELRDPELVTVPVLSANYPQFHIDLSAALRAAEEEQETACIES